MGGDIALVCTQATKLSNGDKTGAWVEEIAAPYYEFKEAGYNVVFASPGGGKIPYDEVSLQGDAKTAVTKRFLEDEEAQKAIAGSIKFSEIDKSSTVGIFVAGGHGAAVDLPKDVVLADLLSKFYNQGKLLAAVCHGLAAFTNAVDTQGAPIVKGKRVTGFSQAEEKAVGKDTIEGLKSPEEILRGLGASYSKASSDWGPHVEVDTSGSGPIVSGENPASSEVTAKAAIEVLKKK